MDEEAACGLQVRSTCGPHVLRTQLSRLKRGVVAGYHYSKFHFGRFRSLVRKFIFTWTIDYDSVLYYYWLWLFSAAYLYNAIFIPIRASFSDFNRDNIETWLPLDYCFADLLYLVDMFIRARTLFYEQGIYVYDVNKLQKHYVFSQQFVMDLISILPFDLFYIGFGYDYVIVRLLRLLRYDRVFEMISRVESESIFPNLFRISTTTVGVALAILYTTVFYHSYSKAIGFGYSDLDFELSKNWESKPFFARFVRCFYWATMMLCFIGEQNEATNPLQLIIEVIIWILGLTVFGVMVGRIGEILGNMSAADNTYNQQLDSIRDYLIHEKLPTDIYVKIVKWFGYAHENNVLGSADKVLKPLTNKLRTDIAMDIHLASLKKVQLFADLEIPLLMELVTRFKLQVFSPQDYVCKKGDIGREMYVVKRGNLEVVSDDGNKIFVTLGAGTVFGEISLLNIPGSRTGNKRTANVRSKGYSDLFSLSKDDLYKVLGEHPGAMQKLIDKGSDILRKEKKLDEDAIQKQEAVTALLSSKAGMLLTRFEDLEDQICLLVASIKYSQETATRRLDDMELMLHRLAPSPKPPTPPLVKKHVTFAEDGVTTYTITPRRK